MPRVQLEKVNLDPGTVLNFHCPKVKFETEYFHS